MIDLNGLDISGYCGETKVIKALAASKGADRTQAARIPTTPARYRKWLARHSFAEPVMAQARCVALITLFRPAMGKSAALDAANAFDLHKLNWMVATIPYPALPAPR